jgi:signal transduction histidine kinase
VIDVTSAGSNPVKRALGALWAADTWRATLHALAGLVIVAFGWTLTSLLVVFWGAALLSLLDGPTGAPVLAWIYVAETAIGLVPLLWWLRAFSAAQRARFHTMLGIEIPAPPPVPGRWPRRLIRAWGASGTWRQVGYHLVALPIGLVGGALVAACWSAAPVLAGYRGTVPGGRPLMTVLAIGLLLVAPWVARGVAHLDEVAARALLGPSRSELLAQRIAVLARSRAESVAATDAERRRIERDLHDGTQQRLLSLAMNLGMARANLTDVPEPARQAIEQAHDEAVEALADLREFVRGLHPAVLNDRGLDAALSGIVARAPLPIQLRIDVGTRCAPSIEAIAYFTVSEALTNIVKHARATRAEVTVERKGNRLRAIVTDDGCGGASLGTDGSGLRGLAQRAAAVDGSLNVHSPTGGPTTITVELPCES